MALRRGKLRSYTSLLKKNANSPHRGAVRVVKEDSLRLRLVMVIDKLRNKRTSQEIG